MKASLRAIILLVSGGLTTLSLPAHGQNSAPPATPPLATPPPADTVGPRELQNFSLPGNVTRSSEQPAAEPTANPSQRATVNATVAPPRQLAPAREQPQKERPARSNDLPARTRNIPAAPNETPQPVQLAPAPPSETLPPAAGPATTAQPEVLPSAAIGNRGLALWPWMLAAFALAASGLVILLRRKPRESYAGASQFDLQTPADPVRVTPPQPQARPRVVPSPAPAPSKSPRPSGIVASGLRPSIEIGVHPIRCLIDDDRVIIEFEVELFNAGTAPARAVLAEASLLNAGAMQSEQLADFFANPIGAGDRLDAIAPMSRIAFSSQVVAERSAIEEYDLAGRKAFVPVIAFNALYQWGGRQAQTSAAYLVGRETRSDKLAPLHLDGGQREIRGLGARALPAAVQT